MTRAPETDRLRLVALSGPVAGEVLPVSGEQVTIGRDPTNAISLADRSLSRTHCVLAKENGQWVVRDLSSVNGTFVNGVQITEQVLTDGDYLKAGESVFLFFLRGAEADVPGMEAVPQSNAPLLTTSRLRLEDAHYLQSSPGKPSEGSAHVEQHLRALLKLSSALNTVRTERELFACVLDHLFEAIPVAGAAVVLADRGELTVAHSRHVSPGRTVTISFPVVSQVLGDQVGRLCREDPAGAAIEGSERPEGAPALALICVPLVARGRALGAFWVTQPADGPAFDDSHLQLVTAVAAIASMTLDNVRHLVTVETEATRLRNDLRLNHSLVGASAPMQRVYDVMAKLSRTEATALLIGETGTGKELLARGLHLNSPRARGPFVAINCAAITETLLETELFGHERGAFTGAAGMKKGKLEVADGGTLFLDEVAELAPALQSKLLRVLQEREFERVGGTRTIKVNIRVIAATNRSLAAEVAAGRFREDLFYRLNVVPVLLPPLRERGEDIERLANHFVEKFASKGGRVVSGISPAAMERLMAYAWPGNVRELENAIERAVVLGSSPVLLPEDLPDSLLETPAAPGRELARFHEAVLETKKRVIIEAFRQGRRSYVEAARLLGLHPNYLHRVIRNLDIKGQLESGL